MTSRDQGQKKHIFLFTTTIYIYIYIYYFSIPCSLVEAPGLMQDAQIAEAKLIELNSGEVRFNEWLSSIAMDQKKKIIFTKVYSSAESFKRMQQWVEFVEKIQTIKGCSKCRFSNRGCARCKNMILKQRARDRI